MVIAKGVNMDAPDLTKPLPIQDPVPSDIHGQPDYNPKNYIYTQDGGPRYRAYHIEQGLCNQISLGVLLTVLKEDVLSQSRKLPRNPMDLLLEYPELRLEVTNYMSEHLLVMSNGKVINFAAYEKIVERNEDPLMDLPQWIHSSDEYLNHRLTNRTGARFDLVLSKSNINPIREYIEECVGDIETANVLHFFFSLCLIGHQTLKMLVIIVGPKNAGKSAVFTLIAKMFGTYSVTFPPSYFLPCNEDRLTKELFSSQGIRFLRVDELGKDSIFNEAIIKRITGRDGLNNPFVTHSVRKFDPQCKIFCDSNYPLKPQFGTQSTIEDRVFYIPFGKVIPKEQRDPFFVEKLGTQENLDTYFSWLLREHAMDAIKGRMS